MLQWSVDETVVYIPTIETSYDHACEAFMLRTLGMKCECMNCGSQVYVSPRSSICIVQRLYTGASMSLLAHRPTTGHPRLERHFSKSEKLPRSKSVKIVSVNGVERNENKTAKEGGRHILVKRTRRWCHLYKKKQNFSQSNAALMRSAQ